MAYLRALEDYLARCSTAAATTSRVSTRCARLVYRKPCFRGQRTTVSRGPRQPLVMTAAVIGAGARADERPAVAAELTFGLHDEGGGDPAAP